MKRLTYLLFAPIMALCAALSSCDTVYDHEGDCSSHYLMRFKFDWNILETDAFTSQVSAVKLWAIDPVTRAVVKEWTQSGEALKVAGYAIEMDLEPGKYDFICWAGEGAVDPQQFAINAGNLGCRIINRPAQRLKPLFYGSKSGVELPDVEGTHCDTIPLIKDTNYLNVSLVELNSPDSQGVIKDDYEFTVTSDDGEMDSLNRIVPSQPLTYTPFNVQPQEVETEGFNHGLLAELTMGRIMATGDSRLTIKYSPTGKEVLSVPLARFLLAVKGQYHDRWDNQEYLDRQDEFRLVFFLSNPDTWMSAFIYVNSWKVVLNDVEL